MPASSVCSSEFINMIIKPLLSLHSTPYFDAVLYKPLDYKRRLIVLAAQAVEHEYQQNVKPALQGQFLDFLNSVPVLCGLLEPGYAFLGKLLDDFPASLPLNKLPAKLFLHRDVVFFNLPYRRDTVKAYNVLCAVWGKLDDLFRHIDFLLFGRCYMAASSIYFQGAIYTIIISYFYKKCKKSGFLGFLTRN